MINATTLYNCFGANFIGISPNCEDIEAPDSGFFISDVIQLSDIAKIATAEDGNGKRMFDRIQKNSIIQTAAAVVTELTRQKVEFQSGRSSDCINLANNRILKLTCTDELGGVFLEKAKLNENTNIYFVDEYGTTQNIDAVEDVVHLNFSGLGKYGYIYANSAPVVNIEEIIHKCTLIEKRHCGCVDISTFENEELAGDGLTDNVFYISCECSYDYLLCSFKKFLVYPIFYHLIGSLYRERWQSGNLDRYVQGTREFSEEMFRTYLHGFSDKKSMFAEQVAQAVTMIKQSVLNRRSKCVKCTGTKIVSLV